MQLFVVEDNKASRCNTALSSRWYLCSLQCADVCKDLKLHFHIVTLLWVWNEAFHLTRFVFLKFCVSLGIKTKQLEVRRSDYSGNENHFGTGSTKFSSFLFNACVSVVLCSETDRVEQVKKRRYLKKVLIDIWQTQIGRLLLFSQVTPVELKCLVLKWTRTPELNWSSMLSMFRRRHCPIICITKCAH